MVIQRKTNQVKVERVLLIDGESLYKQSWHGTKNTITEYGRIGAIYNFFYQIKKIYQTEVFTKIVVFWEGEDSKKYRQIYYPSYKKNRIDSSSDDEKYELLQKRYIIKNCLEDLFIRQVEVYGCEADDAIAMYCKQSNEYKVIYTGDKDLLQLLDKNTKVYLYNQKKTITIQNFETIFGYHHENVGLIKMLVGDQSDNIAGLKDIGDKTVFKLFPEIITEAKDTKWVIERTKELLLENPKNNKLQTIINGDTKWGMMGLGYYEVMDKIINLRKPYSPKELEEEIYEAINGVLDPSDRLGVNGVIKTLKIHGVDVLFSRNDDNYFDFWTPFLTIVNIENKKFKNLNMQ
jgi:5'-3' exonuclease